MRVVICLLLLVCYAITLSPILKSMDHHITAHVKEVQIIPRAHDKFPFEAVVAGAKLTKVLFNRIKKGDASPISSEEFDSTVEKKTSLPLGALLAGKHVHKFIAKHLHDNKDVTVEEILADKAFPWNKVIEASDAGRIITERAQRNVQVTPFKFSKLIKHNNFQKVLREPAKKQVKIAEEQSDAEAETESSDDDERCKQCKNGCNILPPSIRNSCRQSCESTVCRDDHHNHHHHRRHYEFADAHKCSLCISACNVVHPKETRFCRHSCMTACARSF